MLIKRSIQIFQCHGKVAFLLAVQMIVHPNEFITATKTNKNNIDSIGVNMLQCSFARTLHTWYNLVSKLICKWMFNTSLNIYFYLCFLLKKKTNYHKVTFEIIYSTENCNNVLDAVCHELTNCMRFLWNILKYA